MPTFSIIDTNTEEPLEGVTFDDGAVASAFAKAVNATGQGKKFRVLKNPEPAVPDRHGYSNGTYRKTPWHSAGHRDSELWEHVIDDPDGGKMVRFIDPDTKQWAQSKPGRFLTRFYARAFNATEIERWTKRIDVKPPVLLYTRDPDEIERVYTSGPSSCMSYSMKQSFSGLPEHPTRVYASPDLELAYAQDDDGVVFARSLVWRDKEIYGRVYAGYKRPGDSSYNNDPAYEVPFTDALIAAGLRRGELDGARIRKVPMPHGKGYVMPYIDDDEMGASDTGNPEFLIITESGEISGKETAGHAYASQRMNCATCGNAENIDDMTEVQIDVQGHTEHRCSDCNDNLLWVEDMSVYIEPDLLPRLDAVQVENRWGQTYFSRRWATENAVERGGRWFANREVADLRLPLNREEEAA